MKRLALLLGTTLITPWVAHTAQAQILDPLHGFCFVGSPPISCVDAGSITSIFAPNGTFQGAHFGFDISPPNQTGALSLVFAVPNNEAVTLTLSGTINGVTIPAAPINAEGTWTSGDLDQQAAFAAPNGLFPNASPTNPFDNFIGFTKESDSLATGYNLFEVNLGSHALVGPDGSLAAMNLTTNAPIGSMIFGFANTGTTANPDWVATASSGVLWVDGPTSSPPPPPPPPVPEPASLGLLGVGLLGLGSVVWRRRA